MSYERDPLDYDWASPRSFGVGAYHALDNIETETVEKKGPLGFAIPARRLKVTPRPTIDIAFKEVPA